MGRAFQASSPKTSTTRPLAGSFFAHLARHESQLVRSVRIYGSCLAKKPGQLAARPWHQRKIGVRRSIALQREMRRGFQAGSDIVLFIAAFRVKISALANGFVIFADINVISHLHNPVEKGIWKLPFRHPLPKLLWPGCFSRAFFLSAFDPCRRKPIWRHHLSSNWYKADQLCQLYQMSHVVNSMWFVMCPCTTNRADSGEAIPAWLRAYPAAARPGQWALRHSSPA